MRKLTALAGAVLAVQVIGVRPALAVPITIGVVPTSHTVVLGDTVSVGIQVSGLVAAGEVVSAYDLDLSYSSSVLSATGVSFGPNLGDESLFEVINASDVSVSGLIDFAQVSLLTDPQLSALQPDTFTLATIGFDVLSTGTSRFFLNAVGFPNEVRGLNGQLLQVNVDDAIPEPTAALVFAAGLLIAGWAARRGRQT